MNPTLEDDIDQRSYLRHLKQNGFQFAAEFNDENPPPQNVRAADSLDSHFKNLFYLSLGLFVIAFALIFAIIYLPEVSANWTTLVLGLFLVGALLMHHIQTNSGQGEKLRATLPLVSYTQDFTLPITGVPVTFRFFFHIANFSPEIKERIAHDIDAPLRNFVRDQNDLYLKHGKNPITAPLPEKSSECIFLPAFCLICHDLSIPVFRYRLSIFTQGSPKGSIYV